MTWNICVRYIAILVIISVVTAEIYFGFPVSSSIKSFLNYLGSVEPEHWVEMIAAIATSASAFFSWRAVKQAEEFTHRPVVSIQLPTLVDNSINFRVNNLSKTGDKWIRDITILFVDSDREENYPHMVEPEGGINLTFKNVDEKDWKLKDIKLTYRSFIGRKYTQTYKISDTLLDSEIALGGSYIDMRRIY